MLGRRLSSGAVAPVVPIEWISTGTAGAPA